jgi:hypothetical protein
MMIDTDHQLDLPMPHRHRRSLVQRASAGVSDFCKTVKSYDIGDASLSYRSGASPASKPASSAGLPILGKR